MIARVVSVHGVPIRLMEKQWAHIVENHDYMGGCIDIVLETVSDPDVIVQGWTDELIAMKHYAKTVISEKDAVVVYKEEGEDGFVITAFMTSSPERIRKRGIVWRS
jgi:hypothetical protein